MDTTTLDRATEDLLANDAIKLMRTHNKGEMIADLTDALHEVVKKVRAYGKKGALTLKVNIDTADKGEGEVLKVSFEVTKTLPKPSPREIVYFPTSEDGLSLHHPNQCSLDI